VQRESDGVQQPVCQLKIEAGMTAISCFSSLKRLFEAIFYLSRMIAVVTFDNPTSGS
jgi:hypothetical protein